MNTSIGRYSPRRMDRSWLGRYDVGAVRIHALPILDLKQLHVCALLEQFHHHALVSRVEMLDDDERHAVLGWQVGAEDFQRLLPIFGHHHHVGDVAFSQRLLGQFDITGIVFDPGELSWVSWGLLKGKVEGGALVHGRLRPSAPAVPVHDTLNGRQSNPRAGKLGSLMHALKRPE